MFPSTNCRAPIQLSLSLCIEVMSHGHCSSLHSAAPHAAGLRSGKHNFHKRHCRSVVSLQQHRRTVPLCYCPLVLLQSFFEDILYHSPESLQRHPLVLGKSFVHAPGRKTKKGGEMDTMSISGTSEPGKANMCRPAPQVFRPWLLLDIVQSRLVHRSFSPVP